MLCELYSTISHHWKMIRHMVCRLLLRFSMMLNTILKSKQSYKHSFIVHSQHWLKPAQQQVDLLDQHDELQMEWGKWSVSGFDGWCMNTSLSKRNVWPIRDAWWLLGCKFAHYLALCYVQQALQSFLWTFFELLLSSDSITATGTNFKQLPADVMDWCVPLSLGTTILSNAPTDFRYRQASRNNMQLSAIQC